MATPKDDPHDSDDDLSRHLDDYIPEPLNHPYTEPPPPPVIALPAPGGPTDTTDTVPVDDEFTFDIDIDDLIDFGSFNDENVEGGGGGGGRGELPKGEPSSSAGAGPSGSKELGFLWVPPDTLDCGRCTGVSEVHDYNNGLYNMRLVVHAVEGNLDHIVFDVESTDPEINIGVETFFLNFEGQNLELINTSLSKYAIQINQDGSILLLDSFIVVYNRILGGLMNHQGDINCDDFQLFSPQISDSSEDEAEEGLIEPNQIDEANPFNPNNLIFPGAGNVNQGEPSNAANANAPQQGRRPRPNISVQRERTANMTLSDLAPYFHVKAERAAEMLNICPTTLKIVCRKLHLGRWPYRKVKSIDSRIRSLEKDLKEKIEQNDVAAILSVQSELERQREKRARLYESLTRPRPR